MSTTSTSTPTIDAEDDDQDEQVQALVGVVRARVERRLGVVASLLQAVARPSRVIAAMAGKPGADAEQKANVASCRCESFHANLTRHYLGESLKCSIGMCSDERQASQLAGSTQAVLACRACQEAGLLARANPIRPAHHRRRAHGADRPGAWTGDRPQGLSLRGASWVVPRPGWIGLAFRPATFASTST